MLIGHSETLANLLPDVSKIGKVKWPAERRKIENSVAIGA
jgi:hypothetical protein